MSQESDSLEPDVDCGVARFPLWFPYTVPLDRGITLDRSLTAEAATAAEH